MGGLGYVLSLFGGCLEIGNASKENSASQSQQEKCSSRQL